LVQYTLDGGMEARAGVEVAGRVCRLPEEVPPGDLMLLLQDWGRWAPVLRAMDVEALDPIENATLVAPLTYPKKLICAGANYYDHAEEMGTGRPDPAAEPFFFLKPPTTTIVGHGQTVAMPLREDSNVDWEAELGVVISHRGKGLDAAAAGAHIAGYVVANDLSARGLFVRSEAVFPAFDWDWLGHKSQDGFCPMGPGLVPAWMVSDPQSLRISLSVNGTVKQDSNTSQMVVGVNELVAAASRQMTLEPGDVILTGTPAGVGMPRKDFLSAGDLMVIQIDGVGRLENRMV
jgi:2-keto-4-pentenoate hydratase/2-oxohepta-3-ene-1,7-dioic acid hydratase (catechol pathway)